MAGTKFKHAGTAYTNPFENLERKEIRVKVGSDRIARIVFVNGDGAEANSVKQFVNLTRSENFVDGKVVPNVDRAGAMVRLKVYFNKPGTHRFTVNCEPLSDNAKYTQGELARNSRFGYQKEQKSYITASDGSLIIPLDDFYVGAAGKDKYRFRATDSNGITVSTGNLEVHRLIYYIELKMHSLTTCAKNLGPVERTYEQHAIKLIKLPSVEMEYIPNIGPEQDQTLLTNARKAFSKSSAVKKQPHVITIVYTSHLAVKEKDLRVSWVGPVGPESPPACIGIGHALGTLTPEYRYLWQGLIPNEDWFVSANFTKAESKPSERIGILREKCIALPSTSASPFRSNFVKIDVSGLPTGRGKIELIVNVVKSMRAGLSFSNTTLVCVCTKAWWSPIDTKTQNEIIVHEIGHKFGMVADGDGKRPDRVSSFYDDTKGHVGNHCSSGLPPDQARFGSSADLMASKCVMYGSANGKIDFCINCAPAICKVELSEGWRPI